MNIAFVSNVVHPFVKGGAQKRIHEIGRRLAANGHEVTIYSRHYWEGPEETTQEGMTLRAVSAARELYTDDRRSITEAIEFGAAVLGPLARHVDEHDLVVASVFPYFPVLASVVSTFTRDTPVVTTWHEVWGRYWMEYLGALAPFGMLVERLTAKVPQHPIAVSRDTANRLARIGPSRDSITVVPNGVDVERIQSVPPADEGFDVLAVGRLIPEKNIDVLLNAFDGIEGHEDATLGIVGDGPERNALERQVADRELTDRVRFLGFLEDDEDVLAQMRAADLFAVPSVREGFGITFVEALAADCTVIAADHPDSAVAEVIGDGGFLVEPTPSAFADALDRGLSGERPAIEPIEQAGRYDWDRIADQAETVYQDVAQRETGAGGGLTPLEYRRAHD